MKRACTIGLALIASVTSCDKDGVEPDTIHVAAVVYGGVTGAPLSSDDYVLIRAYIADEINPAGKFDGNCPAVSKLADLRHPVPLGFYRAEIIFERPVSKACLVVVGESHGIPYDTISGIKVDMRGYPAKDSVRIDLVKP
jgi:hypothetical protein